MLAALAAGEPVTLDGSPTASVRARVGRLTTHLLAPLDQVPQPGTVLQARRGAAQRNAEARAALAREFGLLDSVEVATLARSSASNQPSTAGRWRSAGKIFSVLWGSDQVYPGFQLDEDRLLPVVSQVLREVDGQLQGWVLAMWFTADSWWLDGARPVDLPSFSSPPPPVRSIRPLTREIAAGVRLHRVHGAAWGATSSRTVCCGSCILVVLAHGSSTPSRGDRLRASRR